MKVLYKSENRTIALYSDTCSLLFRQLTKKSTNSWGPSVAVEVAPNDQISKENGYKVLISRDVHGCLGLITVEEQVFLVVITGAIKEIAQPLRYETVDKIYSVEFVSLTSDEWDFVTLDPNGMPVQSSGADDYDDGNDYNRTVHPCFELRKLLSNGSFYYSNDFDLTSLLQDRGVSRSKLYEKRSTHTRKINFEHYLKDYMWNSFMMKELLGFRSKLDEFGQALLDDNKFLTTVIRGCASTVALGRPGDSLTIISKQSWKRAGTRFNARGIDDNGDVANFVETEVIFSRLLQGLIFAFTEVRGSVPAFWEQDSTLINPKITLTRSLEATQPIFNKHFLDLKHKYDTCHIVNLLSKTKPAEASLLRRYKDLYNNFDQKQDMPFTEFDFHNETKQSGGFAGAAKILPLLENTLAQIGWFSFDVEHDEVITRQNGVFRVNCLDCLDRTNLVQQVISQNVLEHILMNQSTNGSGYRERFASDEIITRHNSIWADNGDAISQIYTGTNALKSSYTRSGKMNFAGAISDVTKSVSRMYQNTFIDGRKQSTMDLLLGYDAKNSKPVKIYDPINDYVQEKLKEQSSAFTTWSNITVFVGTFNVNAASPSNALDLTSWLFPPEIADTSLPDIYAIGLQEMIELNAGSILSADNSKPTQWANLINKQLNSQRESYLLLRTEAISSISLFLFVKKSQVSRVKQVAGSSKKTGMGGITANKGACGVRFDFGLTSIALVTSHLAAGTTAVVERYNEYQTIMQGLKFTRNYTLSDHDHIVWFGDLNYRISMPNERVRSLIDSGAFDELLQNDQLNQELSQKGAFSIFNEGVIKFYPTYKFDKGTSNYDTSEKQRVPSWTDRILYKSSNGLEKIQQLSYRSLMDIYISDHKPVFSLFKCKVKFVDEPKRLEMAKFLYEDFKKYHGDQGDISLVEISDSASSTKPSSSKDSSFTADTLSEMNLLDDFETSGPKLPPRPSSAKYASPRRIPPPPASRNISAKAQTEPLNNANSTSSSIPPPPPPPRKTTSEVKVPVGFSATPLVPNRSHSGTPSKGSPVVTPNNTSLDIKKPLIPAKPLSLASAKTDGERPKSPEKSDRVQVRRSPVPPPPPRTLTNNKQVEVSNSPRTMADWAPLVPK
ncbi:uncharacterized protein PRCAT00003358001 [Priceomyces carsonii]|uniref:uncharacterized protein n=1 Tax=Priceomyces carsonii TaxID=28549 RepID=UPI002ED81666|nr:unnamed protein product [Priceomyces carsonii]